uniref:Uncharacterized protein n=1 Tax=Arundo donax TaxID=35708 RepID=A0A0A8YF06_ARUDO
MSCGLKLHTDPKYIYHGDIKSIEIKKGHLKCYVQGLPCSRSGIFDSAKHLQFYISQVINNLSISSSKLYFQIISRTVNRRIIYIM